MNETLEEMQMREDREYLAYLHELKVLASNITVSVAGPKTKWGGLSAQQKAAWDEEVRLWDKRRTAWRRFFASQAASQVAKPLSNSAP